MRIYADFNAVTAQDVVNLHLLGTLRDLSAAQVKLRDGLVLTLYTDSDEETDLEIEAVVRWIAHPATPSGGYWGGEFNPNAFRDVPRCDSRSVREWFPCSACLRNPAESMAR